MVSFIIDNLYTNIPVHEAVETTLNVLYKKGKEKGKGNTLPFSRTQFKKLLEISVCKVPFRFLTLYSRLPEDR